MFLNVFFQEKIWRRDGQKTRRGELGGGELAAASWAVPPSPAAPETPKEPPTQAQEVPPPAAPETPKEPPTQAQEVPPPAATETPKEPPTQAQEVPPTRLQPRSVPINSFKDVLPVLREMLDQLHHPIIESSFFLTLII
ncbi:hypothetical protein niasHT_018128 [Heterodera trifolii]|uniref:Uncharacterized protein n=1 Tax=Heterodera trifolii TaxID=157864 RepID=A0ABD2L3C3_9BILA